MIFYALLIVGFVAYLQWSLINAVADMFGVDVRSAGFWIDLAFAVAAGALFILAHDNDPAEQLALALIAGLNVVGVVLQSFFRR